MQRCPILFLVLSILFKMNLSAQTYTMPAEHLPHEGTWLQWPHHHEYGVTFRNRLDSTWVAMTAALVTGEKVHIVAYDATEESRITGLLNAANIPLANIDFFQFPTNDVWVRDNGPIFVRDGAGILKIQDWGFNGWGGKFNANLCNAIPTNIATAIGKPIINLNASMTIEGGSYEIDGKGVLLACRSSIISQSPANSIRNLGMTQAQAENILSQNVGISKFIWLDGYTGTDDITDAHIDGFARFVDDSILVTMSNADLPYWGISPADIASLYSASNLNNQMYTKVYVPLTQNDVITTYGNNLGIKGSYCNYFIGNTVVLVPNYNDPNDAVANNIIQTLHPGRTVVGIDCRNLYENGGMIHCVTQQQPVNSIPGKIGAIDLQNIEEIQNYPNPFSIHSQIDMVLHTAATILISIYSSNGQLVSTQETKLLTSGKHTIPIGHANLPTGDYFFLVKQNDTIRYKGKLSILK